MENQENPATPEILESAPETGVETESTPEQAETAPGQEPSSVSEQTPAESSGTGDVAIEIPEGPAPEQKDPQRMQVERFLEDNLWEVYKALPQESRVAFRQRGEVLAAALRQSIEDPKAKSGKVFDDVRSWLKTIPSVNPYFLSQEAKIKTDHWTKLHEEVLGQGSAREDL